MKDVDNNKLDYGDLVLWKMSDEENFSYNRLGTVTSSYSSGEWIDVTDVRADKVMTKYLTNLKKASPEIMMLWKLENA